jgi:arylsulfatase A-like enzyme
MSILTHFVSVTAVLLSTLVLLPAAERPNVIVVMADDLGFGDVSPMTPACKIKTPHLQKMADEGLTFFDAHTPSAVCTPTRYGLLTNPLFPALRSGSTAAPGASRQKKFLLSEDC